MMLRSSQLTERGVLHGFTTRRGGVSEGPFASLNVAVGPGDEPAAVAENLRRVAEDLRIAPEQLLQTSQVHGAAVRLVSASDERTALLQLEADALVCRDPSVAIGVRVADCVPLLVLDEATGHVAAIHAGWRGVVAGVVATAVSTLLDGRSASSLIAVTGPSIGPCCFEVGEEVAAEIVAAASGDTDVIAARKPKPYIDLRRAVRIQLRALGVADARIEDVPGCTMCSPSEFFSFRRDGKRSGRHLAAIRARS